MKTEISNGIITLKRDRIDFAERLFAAAYESRTPEFMRWMPWLKEDYKLSDTADFLEKRAIDWENGTEKGFVIFDAKTSEALGKVGLNRYDEINQFYNLGYWIRVSRQKQGIASQATRLLAEEAFKSLEINRIEILVAVGNIPSQKTAEKAGATREGVLRKRLKIGNEIHDAVIYSFVKEDFDYL